MGNGGDHQDPWIHEFIIMLFISDPDHSTRVLYSSLMLHHLSRESVCDMCKRIARVSSIVFVLLRSSPLILTLTGHLALPTICNCLVETVSL